MHTTCARKGETSRPRRAQINWARVFTVKTPTTALGVFAVKARNKTFKQRLTILHNSATGTWKRNVQTYVLFAWRFRTWGWRHPLQKNESIDRCNSNFSKLSTQNGSAAQRYAGPKPSNTNIVEWFGNLYLLKLVSLSLWLFDVTWSANKTLLWRSNNDAALVSYLVGDA